MSSGAVAKVERTAVAVPIPETVPALYGEAEEEGRRLLERFPDQADSHEVMARLQLLLGKSSEATQHWDRCAPVEPELRLRLRRTGFRGLEARGRWGSDSTLPQVLGDCRQLPTDLAGFVAHPGQAGTTGRGT